MENQLQFIKAVLESQKCKIHKKHPVVDVKHGRIDINSCCCKTFEVILQVEFNKVLSSKFDIIDFIPAEPKIVAVSNPAISKEVRMCVISAYDDYITSRFLLNHGYAQQGAMLASTALEKYIKTLIIATKGKLGNAAKKHFDKWKELAWVLNETPYEGLFERFDQGFLKILETAYKLRYYDNMDTNKITSVGFFINQFVGELDTTVAMFEDILNFKEDNGMRWQTPYEFAFEKNETDLLENNYVLNRWNKQEYMNRKSRVYFLHYDPTELMQFKLVDEPVILPQYNDEISILSLTINANSSSF